MKSEIVTFAASTCYWIKIFWTETTLNSKVNSNCKLFLDLELKYCTHETSTLLILFLIKVSVRAGVLRPTVSEISIAFCTVWDCPTSCDISNKDSCCGFILLDTDECQQPYACRSELICNNTVGSYRCECPLGFTADAGSQNAADPVCVGKELNL